MKVNKVKIGQRVYCIVNRKIISGVVTAIKPNMGIFINTRDKIIYNRNVFFTRDRAENALNSRVLNEQRNKEWHLIKERKEQALIENLFYSYKN